MTLSEAYKALGLEKGKSETERRQIYDAVRERLNAKRANAPTEGLEKKYADALARIDQAIETIESSFDAQELPIFAEVDKVSIESEVLNRSERLKSKRWMTLTVAATLCLVAVLLFWHRDHSENERQQREAAHTAEAERTILETQRAQQLQKQKVLAELRVLQKSFEDSLKPLIEKREQAEAKQRDLQGAERVALESGNKQLASLSQFRLKQQTVFMDWLREYINRQPDYQKLESSKRLENAGSLSQAIESLEEGPSIIAADFTQISRSENDLYQIPVDRFTTEQAFTTSVNAAEHAASSQDYEEAINLLTPFTTSPIVSELAKSKIKDLDKLRAQSLFQSAQNAFNHGDLLEAKDILKGFEGEVSDSHLSEEQHKILSTLNSEYEYELALRASEQALDRGNFAHARSILSKVSTNPTIADRIKVDLTRIDEIEEIERRTRMEMPSGSESSQLYSDALTVKPDRAPRLVKSEQPEYPDSLRKRKLKGFVDITCIVGVDGRPKDLDIISSSHVAFEAPTLEAVKKWRFRPAEKDGVPMELKVRQRIQFNPG